MIDGNCDLPHGLPLEPCLRGRQLGRVPAHVDPHGDRRENPGDPESLGGQVAEVPAEQGNRDLDRWVVELPPQPADQVADREPDRDPAHDVQHEAAGCGREREAPGHDRRDGEPVRDQRGAVVDEALAFDQRDQPAWQAEPQRDRRGRGRVRGRDERAQHEGLWPVEARDHGMGNPRHREHRRQHEPDREQPDRPDVRAELPERGEVGGAVEERGQDGDEHEIRLQLHLWGARDEGDRDPAEHKQDRVRDAEELGKSEQQQGGGEQCREQRAVAGGEAHRHGRPRHAAERSARAASRSRCHHRATNRRFPLLMFAAAVLVTAACDSTESPRWARPQVRRRAPRSL